MERIIVADDLIRTLQMALVILTLMGLLTATASASDARVLLIGATGDRTHRALTQLGFTPTVVSPTAGALRQVNLFTYELIISGMDVNRDVLSTPDIQAKLWGAIENGSVFLGFRDWSGQDAWLPVSVEKDAVFRVDSILVPDHPIVKTPNELPVSSLLKVHSGSMYDAFINPGEGWTPIVGGREVFPWYLDQRGQPKYPNQMHYGIMELPYGRGRIILCQLIPEYDWFENHKGRDSSLGKPLLENLLHYAVQQVAIRQTYDDPPSVPEAYVPALSAVLDVVRRPETDEMHLDLWDVETTGLFEVRWDDRDIITVHHPDQPSQQGGYALLSRTFDIDRGRDDGRVLLSFYCTDDYLGGPEPQYEGDRSVGQVLNMKEGYRFVEVSVDDVLIWERDVLGPNPYEWPYLFQVIDITEYVKDKDRVRVSVRVVDRRETEETFWTDVFVSRVRLLQGIAGREGPGGISAPNTGEFTPVISVHDAPSERSTLVIYGHDQAASLMSVRLTADDQSAHWIVGESVTLNKGERLQIELQREPGSHLDEYVKGVYLIPTAYMAHSKPTILPDVRNWFAAPEAPQRIAAEVKGPLGADISAPVTHGVPFGQGQLLPDELNRIRVLDGDEEPIPVQTRSLALWPDGSVKWALLSFNGRPGPYSLVLTESGVETAAQPLVRQIDERSFAVNTQRLEMDLDLSHGVRIDRLLVDGQDMGPSAADFSITYTNGQRLSLEDSVLNEVRLIEEGPERAVLWMRGNFLKDDRADLEFTWQWYFYREQPVFFVDVAFTNRLGMNVDLSDIRLHLYGNYGRLLGLPADAGMAAGTKDVAVSSEELHHYDLTASSTAWSVVQSDERTYAVYQGGEQILKGMRFPGWLTLSDPATTGDLTFVTGVRHFWQQAPKSAVIEHGKVEFGLWAAETEQSLPVADGFQKTHRILLGWVEPDEAPVWQALLTQPYLLVTDPHYLLGTQALGVMSIPYAEMPGLFPVGANYERTVATTYENYLKKREDRREYGMQSFGDDTFEWGYGPVYTFWSNQEYDHHYGFLLQYLRNRDERFWQIGDQGALHYRDADVIHHSTNPLYMGAPRAHNTKHVVAEGWYPDHNLGGVSVTHAWVEGLWLHYLLTGDELTHEAARGASDWFVAEVERGRWGAGGPERGPGWTLIALAGAYRATSDERYLRAAEKVAEEIYSHQDPVRGLYSVPISEQRSYEGGTSFMTGIMGRGLARLYLETGCIRAALAVARLYDWLTREAMYPDYRFLYKQAPNWRQPTSDSQVVSLLAYGLAFRDRPEDWPMVSRAANISANVRSLSWMPETLALFERLYGMYHPLRLIQPDPKAALIGRKRGPGETSVALARLRATDVIEGVLMTEGVPEGITVSPSRIEYRLEMGQQYQVHNLTVEAEPTVAPGLYDLTVRDPAREDVSITVPVSVTSWQLIDEFREPTISSWFAIELYSRPTEEESPGWEHVKINNIDRLQRSGTGEEYLLYDAPGLYDFTLTMYVPHDQKSATESLLEISAVEGERAEKLAIDIVWEDTDSDLAKATVTARDKYARGDVKLKITVLSGGRPGTPQFERLAIQGWQ